MDAKARDFSFPKRFRILRTADFRSVYKEGIRVSGRYFLAYCLAREKPFGPRVGFTVPRALGKAVDRNRIKRRLRELVRVRLREVGPRWDIVFHARRPALGAPVQDLERELQRVFERCRN